MFEWRIVFIPAICFYSILLNFLLQKQWLNDLSIATNPLIRKGKDESKRVNKEWRIAPLFLISNDSNTCTNQISIGQTQKKASPWVINLIIFGEASGKRRKRSYCSWNLRQTADRKKKFLVLIEERFSPKFVKFNKKICEANRETERERKREREREREGVRVLFKLYYRRSLIILTASLR